MAIKFTVNDSLFHKFMVATTYAVCGLCAMAFWVFCCWATVTIIITIFRDV